jgi:hypothetical protein
MKSTPAANQALQRLEQVFAERGTIGRDKVKRPLYIQAVR